ncbi:MAG: hypothetical protein CMJ74_10865 [Planctomycetaceae bacterium]|nr:hypothetical protein [Planctomycetaceae bacterium]|tara:strand:+ start:363 stop:542 length:180 start_codon:yes stop_codon:yes gene_type:complete
MMMGRIKIKLVTDYLFYNTNGAHRQSALDRLVLFFGKISGARSANTVTEGVRSHTHQFV